MVRGSTGHTLLPGWWLLGFRGPSAHAFTCFFRTKFIAWCLMRFSWGMPTEPIIFCTTGTGHSHFSPCPTPALKKTCAILHLGGEIKKYHKLRTSIGLSVTRTSERKTSVITWPDFLIQNDSVIVLGKTVVLQIIIIFRLSYFLLMYCNPIL